MQRQQKITLGNEQIYIFGFNGLRCLFRLEGETRTEQATAVRVTLDVSSDTNGLFPYTDPVDDNCQAT